MARLILMHDGAVIREYHLDKERTGVGRKPHNEIHLEDPTVSGDHAVFLKMKHIYVEDLGSTNGVILNGKRVTKRQLSNGDIVRIGRHEFKFVDEESGQFDKTVMIPAANLRDKLDTTVVQKAGLVKVVSGPKAGEQILLNKPYTTLGTPGVQVAVIAKRGNNFYLMPMSGTGGKANPPRLNDKPVGAQSLALKNGDLIEVAGTKLQFSDSTK